MLELKFFRRTLARYPDAVNDLSNDTLLRYLKGDLPKSIKWLMRYPSLLRALAEDAEAAQERNTPPGQGDLEVERTHD